MREHVRLHHSADTVLTTEELLAKLMEARLMEFVQTPGGPRPLRVAAVTLLALEWEDPIVRQRALALLDTYRAFVAAGVPELQARGCAADAWDAAAAAAYPLEDPNGWHTIISRL